MKKALVQLHLAVILWGFTAILGKLITLEAPMLVWYRMLLTAGFMLLILLTGRKWVTVPAKGVQQMTRIGVLMAAHWVAFYAAIKFSNASIALVCLSTSSIFTSLLEPWMNKTRHRWEEISLGILALGGMYCIYHFQDLYALGIIFGIVAAMLAAVFTIYNKRIANDYPARTMVFYEMTTGFIVVSLLLPVLFYFLPQTQFLPQQTDMGGLTDGFPGNLLHTPNDWIWLVIMALCCTVWAQTLALNALKKLSSFTIALSVNMEPVYGILLAILIFREDKQLNAGFIIGMLLICLSVIWQTRSLILQSKKKSA
ncbi:DMT family transporter [Rurimicrobium arvi]|uniref:DMT family transporter n=1 Tax=Rurimicrobium arvi TaxID=2049916 RepID=A0ABP8MUM1_9BACT